MIIDLKVADDIQWLDEKSCERLAKSVIRKLGTWLRAESLKRGKVVIGIKNPKRLSRRFLRFSKLKGGAVKLWLGASPIGVDAWGDAVQTESGVKANGKFYEGAFINSAGGSPMVWRRKDLSDSKSPIERVTQSIEQPVDDVMSWIVDNIQEKFNELLEAELNAIL